MLSPPTPPATGAKRYCILLGSVFCLLLVIEHLAPLVLPVGFFYFRPWEYMEAGHRASFSMRIENGYGELANMIGLRRYRVYRPFVWTNDADGWHNPPETQHEEPSIVVGGDSFMAGAGEGDEALFAVGLQRKTGQKTTSFARTSLDQFFTEDRFRGHPPSLLIWGQAERNLIGDSIAPPESIRQCLDGDSEDDTVEKWKRWLRQQSDPLVAYTRQSILRRWSWPLVAEMTERLTGKHNKDVLVAKDGSNMLFFAAGSQMLDLPARERKYDVLADALRQIQDCLRLRGTTFVLLPIPDKEHLYPTLVGHPPIVEEPMDTLYAELEKKGVHFVRLLPSFQTHTRSGSLLYWPDDTHWNARGVSVAVEETAKVLRSLSSEIPTVR